jgi:hypothetical protein
MGGCAASAAHFSWPTLASTSRPYNGQWSIAICGLDAGRYSVWATLPGWQSQPPEDIDLSDGRSRSDVRLSLGHGRPLVAQVLSAQGQPVAGARIRFDVVGYAPVEFGPLRTDLEGRFKVLVPEGAQIVHVQVLAPSQMFWAGCLPLPGASEPLSVTLPGLRTTDVILSTRGGRKDAAPRTDGQLLFFYQQGRGVFSLQDAVNWQRLAGVQSSKPAEGQSSEIRIPALAEGSYAVAWSTARWQDVIREVCTIGPPANNQWVVGGTDAPARLTYTVSER